MNCPGLWMCAPAGAAPKDPDPKFDANRRESMTSMGWLAGYMIAWLHGCIQVRDEWLQIRVGFQS